MADENETGAADLTVEAAARFFSMSESELTTLSRRGILPPIRRGKLPWVETTQRLVAHLRSPSVSGEEGGELIGRTRERIGQLVRDGYIKRLANGRIERDEIFLGYIRFLTDDARRAQQNAGANRVRDARTREIELRTAMRARQLVETEEVVAAMEELVGMVRFEFGGLAAAFTRDLVARRTLDKEVNERFNRIATRLESQTIALREGGAGLADAPSAAARFSYQR